MLNRLFLVLDVLLLVTAGALGVHLYRIWAAAPPAAAAPPPAAPTAPVPAAAEAPRSASPATLGIIAERNLFSPTRSEVAPEPPKPVTATSMAPVRPVEKPRLYGVVLGTDGGARAYLWDPQTRKVFGYKVGDSLGDSRVEQINPDRVVLRRSGEALEVLLRDPAKPKPAVASPSPTPVVPGTPGVPQVPGQFPGTPSPACRGVRACPSSPVSSPVNSPVRQARRRPRSRRRSPGNRGRRARRRSRRRPWGGPRSRRSAPARRPTPSDRRSASRRDNPGGPGLRPSPSPPGNLDREGRPPGGRPPPARRAGRRLREQRDASGHSAAAPPAATSLGDHAGPLART